MPDKDEEIYTDFSNVEKMRRFLTGEELPEGPYGSPIRKYEPVQNKETPWKEGQQFILPVRFLYRVVLHFY